MRTTISLDKETQSAVEILLKQGKYPSMSALVRQAILNMDNIKYEKIILQEIKEIKQLLSKDNQEEKIHHEPVPRRRGMSYEAFAEFLDKHEGEDNNQDVQALCRRYPNHLHKYQEENDEERDRCENS
jgi:Arc/MetJ-type ribon-helix-helix transcriptional regulator